METKLFYRQLIKSVLTILMFNNLSGQTCPNVTSITQQNGSNGTATLTALNNGTLNPTAVVWAIGTGTITTGNNPAVVQFPYNGTYTVCATYSNTCFQTYCTTVNISNSTNTCPVVDSISKQYGTNGTVTLTALNNGTISPDFVYWNLPYTTVISGNNPIVVQYPSNSNYTISAAYNNMCWQYYNSMLSITNSTGACAVVNSISSQIGFNGSLTLTALNNGTISPYPVSWNLGTGTITAGNNPVTVSFPYYSSYTIAASYNNQCWQPFTTVVSNTTSSSCQSQFNIINTATCNVVGFINNSNLGGNYTYYFGDNTSANSTQFSDTVYHTYSTFTNNYSISLTGYNQGNANSPCTSTQTLSINCGNNTCQASMSAHQFTTGCNSYYFINNSNNFSTGNGIYLWDFGDGTTSNSSSYSTLHTYPSGNGTYTATLNMYTANNLLTSCSSTSTTLSVNCFCQASSQFTLFADTANAGNYFAYNNSTGNGTLSYLWNFGDGITSTQQYPFHQYAVPGQYVVCLQVTSATGTVSCTDTHCDSSSVHRMAAGFQMSSITVIPQTVTGIKQHDPVKSLTAYPNPFNDQLTMELELTANTSNISYEIYDALGKVVLKNKITDSKTVLNTNTLANGFYFLSVKDENGSSLRSLKIVK